MKKLIPIFAVIFLFSLGSCMPGYITVTERPAPPVVVRPAMPGAGYVWIEGEWYLSGGRYVYRNGYWTRPRAHRAWNSGHWVRRGNGWYWQKGGWH